MINTNLAPILHRSRDTAFNIEGRRSAQPPANTGESETEMEMGREPPSDVSVPLSSSQVAAQPEVPVASGSASVATTSSSSSAAAGTCATDLMSASSSDSGDRDATVLYNNNGLSTGDVAV